MSKKFQIIPEGVSVPDGAVMELVVFTVKEEAKSGFKKPKWTSTIMSAPFKDTFRVSA